MSKLEIDARKKNDYKCANQIKVIETTGLFSQSYLKQYNYGDYSPNGQPQAYINRSPFKMACVSTPWSYFMLGTDKQSVGWEYDYCKIEALVMHFTVDYSSFKIGTDVKAQSFFQHALDELCLGQWMDPDVEDTTESSAAEKINFDEPGIPATRNKYNNKPELEETIIMSWDEIASRLDRKSNTIRNNKWKTIGDIYNELGKYKLALGLKTSSRGSSSTSKHMVYVRHMGNLHIGLYKNDPEGME